MHEVLLHFDDCAGIGGFALAARLCGAIRTQWAREIDSYARGVYAHHFPTVELFADVREPLPERLVGAVGLYTCGFPCQPVSHAGRRLGRDDPRWLWPHIAASIRFLRPRYILLENVPGLLYRGMGDVLGSLASLGYDGEWESVPSYPFGTPMVGERVWILAQTANDRWASREILCSSLGPWRGQPMGPWSRVKSQLTTGDGKRVRYVPNARICGMADGLPRELDHYRVLGESLVPHIAAWVMRQIVEA